MMVPYFWSTVYYVIGPAVRVPAGLGRAAWSDTAG